MRCSCTDTIQISKQFEYFKYPHQCPCYSLNEAFHGQKTDLTNYCCPIQKDHENLYISNFQQTSRFTADQTGEILHNIPQPQERVCSKLHCRCRLDKEPASNTWSLSVPEPSSRHVTIPTGAHNMKISNSIQEQMKGVGSLTCIIALHFYTWVGQLVFCGDPVAITYPCLQLVGHA